jgi:hypothetical protein
MLRIAAMSAEADGGAGASYTPGEINVDARFSVQAPDTSTGLQHSLTSRSAHCRRCAGPCMDYLYSLYDALINIKVPNDKARAVVDAMERDMATTIATKSDLQLLRQELMSGISLLATKDELQVVRADIAELRQDNALIRKAMEIMANRIDKRIDGLSPR